MWHSGRYQTAQASPVFGQSSGLELPSPSIYQQSTKQISGIVKDQAGIPVIGANVIVKGTTNGVITGLDGDFLLEVPENATLEISYIGYGDTGDTGSGQDGLAKWKRDGGHAEDR